MARKATHPDLQEKGEVGPSLLKTGPVVQNVVTCTSTQGVLKVKMWGIWTQLICNNRRNTTEDHLH